MIKDHLTDGLLAVPTLRFMDRVSNARHGVVLPYNYWSHARWLEAFATLGLTPEVWKKSLGLYRLAGKLGLCPVAPFHRPARGGPIRASRLSHMTGAGRNDSSSFLMSRTTSD